MLVAREAGETILHLFSIIKLKLLQLVLIKEEVKNFGPLCLCLSLFVPVLLELLGNYLGRNSLESIANVGLK